IEPAALRSAKRATTWAAVASTLILASGAVAAYRIAWRPDDSGTVPVPVLAPVPELAKQPPPAPRAELHENIELSVDWTDSPHGLIVKGRTRYPDGVQLYVNVRHAKTRLQFASAYAVVRNGSFQCFLGPLPGDISNELAVGAHFLPTSQSDDALKLAAAKNLAAS